MIYRIDLADKASGWDATGNRQIAWAAIAMVAALAVLIFVRNYRCALPLHVPVRPRRHPAAPAALRPGPRTDQNADVWVSLGFVSFQPGELAKICLAIFFAGYLVRTRESLTSTGTRFLFMTWPRARELGPVLIIWLVSLGIIVLQRDLGTGLLIFGMFVAMLYVATARRAGCSSAWCWSRAVPSWHPGSSPTSTGASPTG